MKKKIVVFGVLGILLFSRNGYADDYWMGTGGKGFTLAVLELTGNALTDTELCLLPLVQGSITGYFNKYSAMTIIDRQNLDKILKEQKQSMSGDYSDEDYIHIGHLINAHYILTGSITKTASNYILELSISDVETGARKVSYPSKPVSLRALENLSAIQEASADLLTQLDVQLTEKAKEELRQAAPQQTIQGQMALAQGIVAQRNGTTVEAAAYYYQAAVFDPSLLEAANRRSVMTVNISSGNIGDDTRNEIQWRRDWLARLTETEEYFANLFKSSSPPYGLFYLTALERGSIDYTRETTSLSFKVNFHAFSTWFDLVPAAVLQAVRDGLNATGRKNDWGLASWPGQTVTNLNPFQDRRNDFAVIFELVNDKKEVIGRQSLSLRGSWSFSFSSNEVSVNYQENNSQTVTFSAVDANKITDTLTIRVASVNGADPETLTRNGSLQITALSAFPSSDFEFSRGVITKYNGSGGNIVIPAIWGEPVKISKSVFEGKGITSVTIQDGVTSIGDRAFYGCRSLTSVTIPGSVISIGISAFYGCESLTSVTIPSSVISIGISAFYGCKSLTSVTIPSSVISIGISAFYGCESLVSVTIPNGVTSIGDRTFSGCDSLVSVTMPGSVTSVGVEAFQGCDSLTSVTISGNVTSIGYRAFRGCPSLKSVTIPGSVISIGSNAFTYCTRLTSVTFGTGSNITDNNFASDSFDGDLAKAYNTGKAGTYIRKQNGATWTKQ